MSEKDPITIDITPTWEGILPTLLLIWRDTESGKDRSFVLSELKKMAHAADLYNSIANAKEEPK